MDPAPRLSVVDPAAQLASRWRQVLAMEQRREATTSGQSLTEVARALDGAPAPHQLLRGVSLLEDLPPAELDALAGKIRLLDVPAGQVIRWQGEHDPHLYAIVGGRVEVAAGTEERPRVKLAVYRPGTLFGRTPKQSDAPNFHTTTALERTLLLALHIDDVTELSTRFPDLSLALDQMYQARAVRYGLRLVSFFSDLDEASLDEIAGHATLRRFDRDAAILRQGDLASSIHVVVRGTVKVVGEDERGELVRAYLKRGAHFGEIGLFRNRPHGASVIAVGATETLQIQQETLEFIRLTYPNIERALVDTVARREAENELLAQDRARQTTLTFMEGLIDSTDVLVIDLSRCVRCGSCEETCRAVTGHQRLQRVGDRFGSWVFATACRHCRDPECMKCPRSAITRDRSGEIHFGENCTGCGACARNCPYGSISIVDVGPMRDSDRPRKRAVKCDLCVDRACMPCVYNCPTGALRRVSPEVFFQRLGVRR